MAVKTVKTGFFRVAVAGSTIDGRTIEPAWLTDIAKTYDTKTYQARVNLEHIRGVTASGEFKSLGDVIAFKTQEDEFSIGGKTEKRVALYAQIEATPDLVKMKQAKQKLYASIEVQPKFAGTETAYCLGLAVTDSPASIGTERLEFTQKLFSDKAFSEALETDFELTEQADQETAAVGAFSAFMNKLTAAITPPAPVPVVVPPSDPAPADPSAFASQMVTGFAAIGAALKEVTDNLATLGSEIKTARDDHAALVTKLEGTAAPQKLNRAPASGGGNGAYDFSEAF